MRGSKRETARLAQKIHPEGGSPVRLAELFSTACLLEPGPDGRPAGIRGRIVLSDGDPPEAGAASVDIAARLGLEVCALSLPLVVVAGQPPDDVRRNPGLASGGDPERGGDPAGRVPLVIGLSAPPWPSLRPFLARPLSPGTGWVAVVPEGVAVGGADAPGLLSAGRWLSAVCPLLQPGGPSLEAAAREAAVVLVREGRVTAVFAADGRPLSLPDAGNDQHASGEAAGSNHAAGTDSGPQPAPAPAPPAAYASPHVHLADRLRQFHVAIEPRSAGEWAALADLAARAGVESTEVSFPIAVYPQEPASGPILVLRDGPGPRLVAGEGRIEILGTERQRLSALRLLAGRLPHLRGHGPEFPGLDDLAEFIRRWLAIGTGAGDPAAVGDEVFSLDWSAPWEVDRALAVLSRALDDARLDAALPVSVEVRVSEPGEVRQVLRDDIVGLLASRGFTPGHIRVRAAHGQAYDWLEADVLPALRQAGDGAGTNALPAAGQANGVARVEIAFRPFRAAGALELPIRWLQDLYPGDDLLARELGLPLEAISFTEAPDLPHALTITARDGPGRVVHTAAFNPAVSERAYLDAFPDLGRVHPPTGLVRIVQNGHAVFEEPVATDQELFWAWYQAEVLPRLSVCAGPAPRSDEQPFFGRLRVEVALSGEDRRLGIREEAISALDALHEDIYFVTLDYFRAWGRDLAGRPFDAPGSIEPFVHAGRGAPRARVTLWGRPPLAPRLAVAEVRLSAIELDGEGEPFLAAVEATPASPGDLGAAMERLRALDGHPRLARFAPLRQVRVVCISPVAAGRASEVVLRVPDALAGAVPTGAPTGPLSPGGPAGDVGRIVPLDRLITPDDLPDLLRKLTAHPGLTAWPAGTSSHGRPIHALRIEHPDAVRQAIRPPAKQSAWRPSLLIKARHHANEVSSTNAVLGLAELAATDPAVRELVARVNLIVIPLENVDGAALHAEMQREHPTWKLHSARFNAVGHEYYGDYADPDTPYGEALVYPALWRSFLPDVVVDDHGVPSHQWVQPFAGWNSAPYFKVSYWLPNAIIYGIFHALPDEFRTQNKFRLALRRAFVEAIESDPELATANRAWRRAYERYGHRHLPDAFPLELVDGVICYDRPFAPGSPAFGARFPDITVAELVTEVPDETATGDHLALCVRAHLAGDLAALSLLARTAEPVLSGVRQEGGQLVRWVGRARPLALA